MAMAAAEMGIAGPAFTDRESVMDEEKVCEYMGAEYSEGQEVCEPEKCMVCRGGRWEDTQIW